MTAMIMIIMMIITVMLMMIRMVMVMVMVTTALLSFIDMETAHISTLYAESGIERQARFVCYCNK